MKDKREDVVENICAYCFSTCEINPYLYNM